MGVKRNNQSNLNTPGPGQYDVDMSMSSRPGTTPFISNSRRDTSPLKQGSRSQFVNSPGPGAYSPKHEVVKYQNPTAKISEGRKGISSKDLSPGPGAYDGLSKEIGKSSTAISIKGRPQTAKLSDTPGPGSYQNDHKTIT